MKFAIGAAILGQCAGTAPADRYLHIVQTAFHPESPDLLRENQGPMMEKFDVPKAGALVFDSSVEFQEILGFGGAFTEASADNWMKMSASDQKKIVDLYFADPSEGGHGYTIGRVPMGSSDFAVNSYSFDNVSGDVDLKHFDMDVTHDEVSGMLPLMRAAQEAVAKHGEKLKIFASPWSPPKWMKIPVNGKQSFDGSAQPVGLMKEHMSTWAKYFSKFISAYRSKGVDLWGVTPQNEPEYAAGWDACVYTPEYEAEFVREHLGPLLHKDHPGTKIIGFDHNKDHVVTWAQVLYGDEETKKYFDGIGVHWYGGLNTQHLDQTHQIAPDKFILATEACNCPGVKYQKDISDWWSRAEKLAIDILEDIKWWSVGWTDWNLMVNTEGGPNHAGNNCDANIVCDPGNTQGYGTVVLQASYYYMGHFSRFLPPGSKRIGMSSTLQVQDKVQKKNVENKMLQFVPCDHNNPAQYWGYHSGTNKALYLDALPNYCAEYDATDKESVIMKPCSGSINQQWETISNGSKLMFQNLGSQLCLTSLQQPGARIGLDPGVDGIAGFLEKCNISSGTGRDEKIQDFAITRESDKFRIETYQGCMVPVGSGDVKFDAVAFRTPKGNISVVAMNKKDTSIEFDIYDAVAKGGYRAVKVPPHSITTFMWPASENGRVEYV